MTSQSDPWIPRFPSIQHLPSGYFFPTEGNHFLTKEELTRKAKKELKEDLETRDNAIKRLRKLIQKEDNLYADTSDAFLVRFLRSRKYDIERAIELVKTYYSAKADYPAIYKNLVPSEVAEVFESGFLTVLPGVDYQGRVVFVASVSNWDPSKISGDQYLRALILACETLLEDECFQISGLMAIVDLSGFTAEQLCQFTPAFCYRLFRFPQDWCPMRFQGVFYVRENAFFDVAFKIASPFIGPKLRERIRFLGEDVDVLKEHFPADILPTSLGGTHDSSNDGRNYLRHLRTKEARFRSNNETYGYKM